MLFPGHSLGYNILGTQDTVKGFSSDDLRAFILENLDTEHIIVSSVSRMPFAKVVKLAERYLSDVPFKKTTRVRTPPLHYLPVQQEVKRSLTQAQLSLIHI